MGRWARCDLCPGVSTGAGGPGARRSRRSARCLAPVGQVCRGRHAALPPRPSWPPSSVCRSLAEALDSRRTLPCARPALKAGFHGFLEHGLRSAAEGRRCALLQTNRRSSNVAVRSPINVSSRTMSRCHPFWANLAYAGTGARPVIGPCISVNRTETTLASRCGEVRARQQFLTQAVCSGGSTEFLGPHLP